VNPPSGASTYRLNYYVNPLTWVSFYITVGKISFIAGDTYSTHTFYVRYVLIPGGVHARVADPGIDQDDYQAECRYYGVPE
jgi:hypothetical protein